MSVNAGIPDGYSPVSVLPAQTGPLKLCVLVRQEADEVGGHLIVLRDTSDARIYLGCICDAAGAVTQWVEIWIQTTEGFLDSPGGHTAALTNGLLDQRWIDSASAVAAAGELIHSGHEGEHPLPIAIHLPTMSAVNPVDAESGGRWQLCRDEARLAKLELPTYSGSLHRYLWVPEWGDDGPLVPVTTGAPETESMRSRELAIRDYDNLVRFNLHAGLMMVRPYQPIGLDDFVDVVGGATWDGVLHGRTLIDPGGVVARIREDAAGRGEYQGHLFLGSHGKWGRFVEGYHLKLHLLAQAIQHVARLIEGQQRPLLNLCTEHFRVSIGSDMWPLPHLWTSRVDLVDIGDAVELRPDNADACTFLRPRSAGPSVYWPDSVSDPSRGVGEVRVRQVVSETQDEMVLEGTLRSQDVRLATDRNDLVWLRPTVGSSRINLYATLDTSSAMASGEARFRTVSQRLPGDVRSQLKAAQGVPMADTEFEIIPVTSSPCDLYAMGVVAVRLLLVDGTTTLPRALDELMSLAREVGQSTSDAPLAQRIQMMFESDLRWIESLGPQRCAREEMTSQDAFDLIPAELWFETLAMIVRMFPGLGPDSVCRDFGDARDGALQRVFESTISDLDRLITRSRSLIVIDWRFNREVHAIVRRFSMGVAGDVSVPR